MKRRFFVPAFSFFQRAASLREHFAQMGHSALFEPRDLHLRHAKDVRRALLRETAVVAQCDHALLLFGQGGDRL